MLPTTTVVGVPPEGFSPRLARLQAQGVTTIHRDRLTARTGGHARPLRRRVTRLRISELGTDRITATSRRTEQAHIGFLPQSPSWDSPLRYV